MSLEISRLGVVITSYKQEEWLDMVLHAYTLQSAAGFHIYIADDGSGAETKAVIEKYSDQPSFKIHHIWHEDQGFRKCEILNKAIVYAEHCDYLIFTDGDCVPEPEFMARHQQLAEEGRFLSGGYCKLARETSLALTKSDIDKGHCFNLEWLNEHGTKKTRRLMKLARKADWVESFLDKASTAPASFNGHNSSAWRSDLIAVNGFDQRMEWGGLDREIGERLENHGIKGKRIRHRVRCVHLWHKRGYKKPESIAFNQALRRGVRKNKVCQTPAGISQRQ